MRPPLAAGSSLLDAYHTFVLLTSQRVRRSQLTVAVEVRPGPHGVEKAKIVAQRRRLLGPHPADGAANVVADVLCAISRGERLLPTAPIFCRHGSRPRPTWDRRSSQWFAPASHVGQAPVPMVRTPVPRGAGARPKGSRRVPRGTAARPKGSRPCPTKDRRSSQPFAPAFHVRRALVPIVRDLRATRRPGAPTLPPSIRTFRGRRRCSVSPNRCSRPQLCASMRECSGWWGFTFVLCSRFATCSAGAT